MTVDPPLWLKVVWHDWWEARAQTIAAAMEKSEGEMVEFAGRRITTEAAIELAEHAVQMADRLATTIQTQDAETEKR